MNSLQCFLQEYPFIGGTAIASVSASLGWILRNFFDIFVENQRYKREQRTYFWKEKIKASKKASEFYLEYANFLNLARIQFESFRLGKIEHESLIENFKREVAFYADKLKSFPHFEHHHINIFYEFDEKRAMEISNKINATNREILELDSESDNAEKASGLFKILEDSYTELFDLQKEYTKRIRDNLSDYV